MNTNNLLQNYFGAKICSVKMKYDRNGSREKAPLILLLSFTKTLTKILIFVRRNDFRKCFQIIQEFQGLTTSQEWPCQASTL